MKSVAELKKDFPIFSIPVKNKALIYLDNASTVQVPDVVVDAIVGYYHGYKANVDRGIYQLAEQATSKYQQARVAVSSFIGALPHQILWTKNATDSLNTAAMLWARHRVQAGDEIIVSDIEHHSNLLVWQQLCLATGAVLKIVPVNKQGYIQKDVFVQMLSEKTKIVALVHTSNVLGTTQDIQTLTALAHQKHACVVVDGAQTVAHHVVNVQELGVDFYAFSGHKAFGPTGVGVLYVSDRIAPECKAYQFGGGMVYNASYEQATFKKMAEGFEAGTPAVAEIIGFAQAIEWINQYIDFTQLERQETELVRQAWQGLVKLGFVCVSPYPEDTKTNHLVTFYHEKYHAHDIAAWLDRYGICVRAGHHCVQPYHDKIEIPVTVRVSFACYNSSADVQVLLKALQELLDA